MKKPVKNTKSTTSQAADMRRQAEKIDQKNAALSPEKIESLSPQKLQKTLHELRVHQIELEMQKEELLRSQEELDTALSRYFDLYDLAPVGYITVSEKSLILEANLTAATMLQIAKGKLVKQLLTRFILKKDQDIYYLQHKKLLETGDPQVCELRMVKKDGTAFWAHLTATVTKDEGGAIVCRIVLSDITDRNLVEEVLKKSKEQLKEAHRLAHIGIWSWVAETDTVTWSEELYHIAGIDTAKPAPSYAEHSNIYAPASWKLLQEGVHQALNTGKPYQLELQIIRPDGTPRWCIAFGGATYDNNGRNNGLHGTLQDITERKLIQTALQDSEAQKKAVLNGITTNIALVDKELKILWVNKAAINSVNGQLGDLVGHPCYSFWGNKDAPCANCPTLKAFKTGKSEHTIVETPDGRIWDERGEPILDEAGNVIYVIEIAEDITARKHSDDLLRESEERYRTLFEESPDGIIIHNADGLILKANEKIAKRLEIPLEQLPGHHIAEFITPENAAKLVDNARNTLAGPSQIFETTFVSASDNTIPAEVHECRIEWNNEQAVLSISRDITERKQAEEKLCASEEKYRSIFEYSPLGLFSFDEKGLLIACNNNFVQIIGSSRKKLIGLNMLNLPDKKIVSCVQKTLDGIQAFYEGNYSSVTAKKVTPVRGIFSPITVGGGKISGGVGIFEDITEHKQAEEKLRESEEKYRLLFETAGEGILIAQGDMIKFANPALSDILGYQGNIITTRPFSSFIHPDDRAMVVDHHRRRMHGEKMETDYDFRIITDAGTVRWVHIISQIISWEGTVASLSFVMDITARKKAEVARRESEEKYRDLFENSVTGLFKTVADGSLVDANNAFARMYGYSDAKEILAAGLNVSKKLYANKEDREKILNILEEKRKIENYETLHVKQDGTTFWVSITARTIRDTDGKIIFYEGTIIDITERKLIEEKLYQEEERFRALAEQSSDIIVFVNREGIVTYENPAMEKYLGFKPEERIGTKVFDRIHPDDLKIATDAFNLLPRDINDPVPYFEIRLQHKDGNWRSFEAVGSKLVKNNIVDTVIINLRDINDRKKAESEREAALEALRESETQYRTFFKTSRDCVFITTIDGNWVEMNDGAIELFGYSSRDELMQVKIPDIYANPQDRTKFISIILECGYIKDYPVDLRRKDGEVINTLITSNLQYDVNGSATGLMGTIKDITRQKKAEQEIIKLALVVQFSSELVNLATPDGQMIFLNLSGSKMLGIDPKNVSNYSIMDFIPEPFLPTMRQELLPALLAGNNWEGEMQYRNIQTGVLTDVHVLTFSIKDAATGVPVLLANVSRDITERRRTEEELKKYRDHLEDLVRERTIKLESSNKELEAFSYSVSHDLRAPIRAIDGFSQALLEDCENMLDIQGKDYLTRIRAATRQMYALIEDLLNLSKITLTGIKMEKVDLTKIVRSVIDDLQKAEPERLINIKIANVLEDTADSKLISIALGNLLGNAWKFTGKQSDALIEFGSTKQGGKTVYFVRDNGAGFEMAYADKLFVPFQRLHTLEEFPGTGIGLAIVRHIIFRHGGKIWAEGQVGKGATFYFTLQG